MVSDLSHQSRRALPRDWVASKVAVHEDCDHVNIFSVFDLSALLWAFLPDIARHTLTGQSRIREAHSFSGPNVSLFQQDPLWLGPSMKVSCKHTYVVLLHLFSESDSVFRLTPVCLVVSLSWCAHCFRVRIAS